MTSTLAELEHHFADVNGIRMHYIAAGAGETVVMLHGFPESWYSWRHQIAALSPHYRVIAPDLRGYNETENRGPYDTDTLQNDVLGLIEHLGESRVHVIGHDWGAAIAWLLAIEHPEAVRSLGICNVPHPAIFAKGIRRPRQLLRSWYIFFFQLPWLPERLMAFDNYHMLARNLIHSCRPGTFTREDITAFLANWRRQGLSGGINWYRAVVRDRRPLPGRVPLIMAPTVFIWGERDFALGRELTHGTEEYVHDLTMRYLPEASHWVQQEEPDRVSEYLLEHLRRAPANG